MAKGLPDFQTPINIAAQSLATLAIDIASQTLATLGVNIKAQDLAKLAVDITTQTLSALKINITAQDLASLVISIAAQTVGVYLQPEWAVTKGANVALYQTGLNKAWNEYASQDIEIQPGPTLYITDFYCSIFATGAANYDHHLYFDAYLYDVSSSTIIALLGGIGGASISLKTPVAVGVGHTLRWRITNKSNVACDLAVGWGGFWV